MKTSDAIDQLAAALAMAQAEMEPAVFNRTNPHFKSRYADLAAIRDATLPALNKYGLSIVQATLLTAVGFVLFSRLIHKSGQWIEGEYPITIGTPQSMGSQLTYARRYSWSGLCGITADEDDDAEAAEKDTDRQAKAAASEANVPVFTKTLNETQSLEELQEVWEAMQATIRKWPEGSRKKMIEAKDSAKERLSANSLEADREALR